MTIEPTAAADYFMSLKQVPNPTVVIDEDLLLLYENDAARKWSTEFSPPVSPNGSPYHYLIFSAMRLLQDPSPQRSVSFQPTTVSVKLANTRNESSSFSVTMQTIKGPTPQNACIMVAFQPAKMETNGKL